MKKVLIAVAMISLVACGTEYQPQGLTGGYSDTLTGPNTAIVEFKGNGYLSSTTARKYAFRRAAELTLQNGFDYFLVEDGADTTKRYSTSGTTNCYTYGGAYGLNANCYSTPGIEGEKPRTKLQIRMFKGKTPNKSGYYDARFLTQT